MEWNGAHGERVKAFLAGSVPDLISEHAVLEATLLCEESVANGRSLCGREFVGDLRNLIKLCGVNDGMRIGHTTKRRTRRQKICSRQPHLQD
jgi:hypothetical protein